MSTLALVRRPGLRGLRTSRPWLFYVCAGFAALVVMVALLAPWLAPADPNASDLGAALDRALRRRICSAPTVPAGTRCPG